MAATELVGKNLDGQGVNDLRRWLMHRVASGSKPGSPAESQAIWLTDLHRPEWWNGSIWLNLLDRANHSGDQLAATISNFDTAVRLSRLDQMAAPTGSVNFGSQRATSLADPTSAQDAATQAYVLAQIAAAVKPDTFLPAARMATTTNVASLSGLQNFDSVTAADGDVTLLTAQTTGSQNGPWVQHTGAWTRPTYFDQAAEVKSNVYQPVAEGSANGDSLWYLTTNDPITLGTTSLTWIKLSQGTTYTAGNGLSLTTGTFAVVAGSGIIADGTSTRVDFTIVVKKATGTVGNGSATSGTITHNLGNKYPCIHFFISDNEVDAGYDPIDTNSGTWQFAPAPATNAMTWSAVG